MIVKPRTIEVDASTAEILSERAAARGVSVGELVKELTARDDAPLVADTGQIAELDRRWARARAGTIDHDDVVRWLETWGTPAFRPWRER